MSLITKTWGERLGFLETGETRVRVDVQALVVLSSNRRVLALRPLSRVLGSLRSRVGKNDLRLILLLLYLLREVLNGVLLEVFQQVIHNVLCLLSKLSI